MHISREEEIKWRIKSRQLWLKEGDKNTAYFHKQAIARKPRNNVSAINDSEGNHYNNQEDIKRAASSHFRSLLTETQEEIDYSDLLQYLPKGITQEINESLNRDIEEEEIRKAIWTLQPDKSPGPDGFPINFYRDYWQLIKKDLAKMLRGIQRKGKMGGFTNSTFLALIPKENRPTSFSRFRPISLCNSSYKIFTKIIAMRLQPLLPSLISENQGGFLSNRQIHDSITLVQEDIHSSTTRQEKGFVPKLDLANAFDRLFLIDKVKRKVQQWGTHWLNPAGRLILLKSGITALPLYRFTLYQAPAIFHHKLEVALRNFLWQGGKKEKNRFNLVSWKNVIQSQDRGGLGIRAPKILNLAFGIKMAWRLINGPTAWWKQFIESKYINGTRQRLLEDGIPNRDSSKIWHLCKKAIPFLRQNTSKTPGGGDNINFATDKIMGFQPLNTIEEALPVIHYLNSKGIHRLGQILKWGPDTHAWTDWDFPGIPTTLEASFTALKVNLHNRAPIKKEATDGLRWDPTGSNYTVKSGHQYICNNTYQIPI
eukprot:PITA_03096